MQDRFTKLARGKECMIRLPCCNFDPETTVLAHFRFAGVSGMGLKVPSLIGAWSCSRCHEYVDSHRDDATQLAFALGVFRTQAALLKAGVKAGWKLL